MRVGGGAKEAGLSGIGNRWPHLQLTAGTSFAVVGCEVPSELSFLIAAIFMEYLGIFLSIVM